MLQLDIIRCLEEKGSLLERYHSLSCSSCNHNKDGMSVPHVNQTGLRLTPFVSDYTHIEESINRLYLSKFVTSTASNVAQLISKSWNVGVEGTAFALHGLLYELHAEGAMA